MRGDLPRYEGLYPALELYLRFFSLLVAGGAYVAKAFVAMYAPLEGYNLQVPKLQHYYGLNHLHYLTNNTYRRARL